MKIIVTGTRGIPDILGGVETHCEKLYPIIVDDGYNVTLVRRSCYVSDNNKISDYKGIKIKDIYAPHSKSLEAIVHTFLAVCYAKKEKADVLHIHAIGPAILTPFARLLGLKVVVTHHGADYERQKWGKMAKFMLKTGERNAAKYANHIISISDIISQSLKDKYGRTTNVHLIFNGVDKADRVQASDYLKSLGLEKQKYIFALGRFVEEKGFDNLIKAYAKTKHRDDIKLVIAGDADHETEYSLKLKDLAKKENVVLPGFIKGDHLKELFSNAALFVLPSFHEGLPIALLEAMSYNLDVLISNIPANTQVLSSEELLFDPNNIEEMASKIDAKLSSVKEFVEYDLSAYNWFNIAAQTEKVYNDMTSSTNKKGVE
ncbi:MAG: glycosyltransferase family 4 protein [Dysgonomonas sp.]